MLRVWATNRRSAPMWMQQLVGVGCYGLLTSGRYALILHGSILVALISALHFLKVYKCQCFASSLGFLFVQISRASSQNYPCSNKNGIENNKLTSLIVSKKSENPAKAIILQIYVPNTLSNSKFNAKYTNTKYQEHKSVILLLLLDILISQTRSNLLICYSQYHFFAIPYYLKHTGRAKKSPP